MFVGIESYLDESTVRDGTDIFVGDAYDVRQSADERSWFRFIFTLVMETTAAVTTAIRLAGALRTIWALV